MKLKYYRKANLKVQYVRTFTPDRETGTRRLGVVVDGQILTGAAMKAHLEQPLFPDVPLSVALPVVRFPSGHWEYGPPELVEQENGTYVAQTPKTWVEDVSAAEYNALKEIFQAKIQEYLVTVKEVYNPIIPGGPEWAWAVYDPTAPPRYQWKGILSEAGRYNGSTFLQSETDLSGLYTEIAHMVSNPTRTLAWRVIRG